jgi:hypothetical protein
MIANKSQGLKFKEKQTPKIKNRCTLRKEENKFYSSFMSGEPQICRSGLLIKAKRIYAAFGARQPLYDATVRHSTQNNWIAVYVIPKKNFIYNNFSHKCLI